MTPQRYYDEYGDVVDAWRRMTTEANANWKEIRDAPRFKDYMNGVWSHPFKELTRLHDAFIQNITKDEELSNIEEWVQKRDSIAGNLQLVGKTMERCLSSYKSAKEEVRIIHIF
ncbi:hypothetical protein OCU04_006050 [Sclerotinia nivalis]|uniref:Uncharacterized protein n=1 Tax=Sclerotinia nivalis TaxID=352851 RepID=A0A9X0AM65_9HELO|nr:hypothetical protein OCU04_006050 [Sclerotinia nivalis]